TSFHLASAKCRLFDTMKLGVFGLFRAFLGTLRYADSQARLIWATIPVVHRKTQSTLLQTFTRAKHDSHASAQC
ncbi:MAG: hypothetical protein AAFP99_10370, partial [Pseudomonadota bacterium]